LGDFTANQLRRERNGNCVCFQTASLSRALLLLSRSRKERCVQRGRVLIDKKREREREMLHLRLLEADWRFSPSSHSLMVGLLES
jgi:hypothetical protein